MSCRAFDRELRVQRGTRIIELLVVLDSEVRKRGCRTNDANFGIGPLEHDPEKWIPVFGKDHAPLTGASPPCASPSIRFTPTACATSARYAGATSSKTPRRSCC